MFQTHFCHLQAVVLTKLVKILKPQFSFYPSRTMVLEGQRYSPLYPEKCVVTDAIFYHAMSCFIAVPWILFVLARATENVWLSGRPETGESLWWLSVIKCLLGVSHPAQPFASAALESWQQPHVSPSPASLLPMSNWSTKWPWKCLQLLTSISGNQDLGAGGGIGLRNVDMCCLEGPGDMTELAGGAECQGRTWS